MDKKICGARVANFTGKDGKMVEGYQVSFTSPISPDNGKGIDAESHYISKAKLESWGVDIMASVGRNATIFVGRTATGRPSVVGLMVHN